MKAAKIFTVRLGTRASALALTQSRMVARQLERAHRGLRVDLIEITTHGDRDQTSALKVFGGAGVFTKELEAALLDSRVDFAVHSLKDLPTKQPRGLLVAAVSAREDVRDVLIMRGTGSLKELAARKGGALIGSGSPRRRAQLALPHPTLRFAEIRGNVETRLRKVVEGHYDATILARAGLKRLGFSIRGGKLLASAKGLQVAFSLKALRAEVLPPRRMLPAPGQGALGLECRSNDARTRKLLAALHSKEAAACVAAERACLAGLGGGCHLPLGALGVVEKGKLTLRAVLALPDGSAEAHAEVRGPLAKAELLGKAAARGIAKSPVGCMILKTLGETPSK
jgi:hydroxymethylbilane synthase